MISIESDIVLEKNEVIFIDSDSVCNLINCFIVNAVADVCNSIISTIVFENKSSAISYLFNNQKHTINRLVFLNIVSLDDDWFEILDLYQRVGALDKVYILSAAIDSKLKQKCINYSSVIDYIEKPLTMEFFHSIVSVKRSKRIYTLNNSIQFL